MSKWFEKDLKLLSDTLWQIWEKQDFDWFLEDILTPQEIIAISERIKLIKMLKQWKTQKEIAEILGISVTTVNRGSRMLKFWTWSLNKLL